MSAARILYRTRQFWQTLRLSPTPRELGSARSVLSPAQIDLFSRMQPGEQYHSLRVYSKLVGAGESNHDLLVAALLHDAGKTLYPLKLWERAWIVIGKALLPRLSQGWSQEDIRQSKRLAFWKRPFIVAERHPEWGADLASQAGASDQTVSLIRRHQEGPFLPSSIGPAGEENEGEIENIEDWLLGKLQATDNES